MYDYTVAKKIYFIIISILFFTGIISFFVYRSYLVKKEAAIPFSPKDTILSLDPPSSALIGKVVKATGTVEKLARDKKEFEKISEGIEILQGESIKTDRLSNTEVEFLDYALITLSQNTQVVFANLLPSNFLIHQIDGQTWYKIFSDKPISIRILHSLITIHAGEMDAKLQGDLLTIQVIEGQTKLAMVNLDNETNIYSLAKGDSVSIDDANRRVEIN